MISVAENISMTSFVIRIIKIKGVQTKNKIKKNINKHKNMKIIFQINIILIKTFFGTLGYIFIKNDVS